MSREDEDKRLERAPSRVSPFLDVIGVAALSAIVIADAGVAYFDHFDVDNTPSEQLEQKQARDYPIVLPSSSSGPPLSARLSFYVKHLVYQSLAPNVKELVGSFDNCIDSQLKITYPDSVKEEKHGMNPHRFFEFEMSVKILPISSSQPALK